MKKLINFQNVSSALSAIALGAILNGCATSAPITDSEKPNPEAAAKSKVYVDDVYFAMQPKAGGVCHAVHKNEKTYEKLNWHELTENANACVFAHDWAAVNQVAAVMAANDLNSPWAAYFMSVAAGEQGEFSRALWMADLAIKKSGASSGIFVYQKARVLYQMKDVAGAMRSMQKASDLDPKLLPAHLMLADIYRRDAEFDLASVQLEQVIQIDANHYSSLLALADINLGQDKIDQALSYYQRANRVKVSELEPWLKMAQIFETKKKNAAMALQTYIGLKSAIDSGNIKDKPGFDLNEKIRLLETESRAPAQASDKQTDEQRSTK